jgi:hypothetical protein
MILLLRSDRTGPTGIVLALLLAALSLAPVAWAQTLPFTLGTLASGTEVPLTVTSDSELTLHLVRTKLKDSPPTIDLQVTQFTDDAGRQLDVQLIVGNQPDAPKRLEHRGLALTGPVLPVRLAVPQLRTPGKYIGFLILSSGNSDPLVWRIVLNPPGRARPATLEINPRVKTVSIPCLFQCGQVEHPDFYVSLGDKTGMWPLDTITVRQEQTTTDFDLRNLTFWFNGVKSDLSGTASSAKKTATAPKNPSAPPPWMAARGERPVIGIAVHGLPAGEHTTTLRFQASNSGDDDGQKLALTVRVRHSMLWALLLLVAAVVVSFVTTKILVMIRQHLAFMSRVRDLDKGWLWQMDCVRPVVWARDVLHQTQALSRRYWLTGQARIDTQLTQISTLLGVLEKAHMRQQDFTRDGAFSSDFVQRRALAALDQTVRDLDGASLSDQRATQIKTQLDSLADWVIRDKEADCYSAALLSAINDLLRVVRLERIPDEHGRKVAEKLKTELENTRNSLPREVPALEQIDEKYARLKILWERRDLPELKDLIAPAQPSLPAPLLQFFKVADDAVWRRLESSPPTIRMVELGAGVKVEAYELLRFAIVPPPNVAGIAGTYLFEHKLDYRWTFTQK